MMLIFAVSSNSTWLPSHGAHAGAAPANIMHGVVCAAGGVVATALRHRGPAARRCMPVVVECARGVLGALGWWGAAHAARPSGEDGARLLQTATALAR